MVLYIAVVEIQYLNIVEILRTKVVEVLYTDVTGLLYTDFVEIQPKFYNDDYHGQNRPTPLVH